MIAWLRRMFGPSPITIFCPWCRAPLAGQPAAIRRAGVECHGNFNFADPGAPEWRRCVRLMVRLG